MTGLALALAILLAAASGPEGGPDQVPEGAASVPAAGGAAVPTSPVQIRPVDVGGRVGQAPSSTPAPPAVGDDPLVGQDKLRHFAMAFAAAEVGYGVARIRLSADAALTTSLGAALLAAIGKEVHDHRYRGHFSVPDLAWGLAGVALGAVLVREIR